MSGHAPWCQGLFHALTEGGVWGVPRSGLVFRKQGDALVLDMKMPHEEGMPVTAAELDEIQEADFRAIKLEFEQAGIAVTKAQS